MKRYFKHALIAAFSVLLLAVIAMQVAAVGAILWLRSDAGQDFIKAQMETALRDSPYQVSFSHFSYSFPQGLRINDIAVADVDGRIAELDRITLRPALLPLAMKRAGLSVRMGTLVLHRLPAAQDEVQAEQADEGAVWLEPFTLPDLMFNQFFLSDFSIDTLDIREGVSGAAMKFSPSLWAKLDIRDGVDLALDWQAKDIEGMPAALPEDIRVFARLDPQTLDFTLGELVARSALYRIEAQGKMNAGGQGAGELSGRASFPDLNKQGLDDITFSAQILDIADAQKGKIAIESAYQSMSISLTSDVARRDTSIILDPVIGTAPDLALSGALTFNQETSLVSGALKADIASLQTYSALAGVDLSGKGQLDLALDDEGGKQGAKVILNASALGYDDIRAAQINLNAALPDVSAGLPNSLDLDGKDIVIGEAAVIPSVKAALNDKGNDTYGATIDMKATAQGETLSLKGGATLSGLQAQDFAARDIDLAAGLRGETVKITGAADLQTLNIKLATRDFALKALPAALPAAVQDMALDATLDVTGTPALPVLKAAVKSSRPVQAVEGFSAAIALNADYADGQAKADLNITGEQIKRFEGHISLPLRLSLYPYALDLGEKTPLSGALNADADLGDLSRLFLPPDQDLSGALKMNATIAGTIAAPGAQGQIALSGGAYQHDGVGAALEDITLDAAFSEKDIRITTLSAYDGEGGTLTGSGAMNFVGGGSAITIKTNNMHLLKGDQADGYVTSDLAFQGQGSEYGLSGSVNLENFNIQIPERFHASIPQLNIVEKPKDGGAAPIQAASVINLDIDVNAENRIFVRGWGLDAEFGGALEIAGDLSAPLIHGNFSSIRGRYEEFGKRFDLERADLRFQGAVPPSPYLDIVAVTDTGEVQATVNLSGAFQEPKLELSSTPALPQDEVLSRILFGKDMSRITPFQAIQLKNTLDRFTGKGGGGFDPASMLRSVTGLDDIRVDTDAEGQASVGVGKYLTDKVYMEFEKGAGEASGAAKIQVEVTPSINVETQVGQDAQAGGGVFWKWDY